LLRIAAQAEHIQEFQHIHSTLLGTQHKRTKAVGGIPAHNRRGRESKQLAPTGIKSI